MGALDDSLRSAVQSAVGFTATAETVFVREGPPDYATGDAQEPVSWEVLAGPPESSTEMILARGGLPDASTAGELRITVPALNVPDDMVEPRMGDRVRLPGETDERTVVAVERLGAELPAAWIVRVRP